MWTSAAWHFEIRAACRWRDRMVVSRWGGRLPISRKKRPHIALSPSPLPFFPIRFVSFSPAASPSPCLAPVAAAASALPSLQKILQSARVGIQPLLDVGPRLAGPSSRAGIQPPSDGTAAGGSVVDWRRSIHCLFHAAATASTPVLEVRLILAGVA